MSVPFYQHGNTFSSFELHPDGRTTCGLIDFINAEDILYSKKLKGWHQVLHLDLLVQKSSCSMTHLRPAIGMGIQFSTSKPHLHKGFHVLL